MGEDSVYQALGAFGAPGEQPFKRKNSDQAISDANRESIAKENPSQLIDMTDRRCLRVHSCSESPVRLSNIVQKRKSAEPGASDLVKVGPAGGCRQAPADRRLEQQRLHHGGDIGRMVDKRMPPDHPPHRVAFEFSP
jgi:hypothetical protein